MAIGRINLSSSIAASYTYPELLESIIAIDSDTIGDTLEISPSESAILLCENIDIGIGDTFLGIIAIDYRDTRQYR